MIALYSTGEGTEAYKYRDHKLQRPGPSVPLRPPPQVFSSQQRRRATHIYHVSISLTLEGQRSVCLLSPRLVCDRPSVYVSAYLYILYIRALYPSSSSRLPSFDRCPLQKISMGRWYSSNAHGVTVLSRHVAATDSYGKRHMI